MNKKNKKIADKAVKKMVKEYDKCLKMMGNEEPIGVSQWAQYGKKMGYWDYFEKEIIKKYIK
jgi:hypothetical protein